MLGVISYLRKVYTISYKSAMIIVLPKQMRII